MVTTLRTDVPRRLVRWPAIACLLLAAALAAPLRAGGTLDVTAAGPALEALFWQCDYAITTRPVCGRPDGARRNEREHPSPSPRSGRHLCVTLRSCRHRGMAR
jgi:hypothetical protein